MSVDSDLIQALVDEAEARGGGVVQLDPRIYEIDTTVTLGSNGPVKLRGAGIGATTIKLANSTGATAMLGITGDDATGVEIEDMTLDGNRANQGAVVGGHCIRVASTTDYTSLRFARLLITGPTGYGIGIQLSAAAEFDAGHLEGLVIDQVVIEDVGTDGIDMKNDEVPAQGGARDYSEDGSRGIFLRNIVVDDYDKFGDNGKAALDVRGITALHGIVILKTVTGNDGFRFRADDRETTYPASAPFPNGGSEYATLAGYYIRDTAGLGATSALKRATYIGTHIRLSGTVSPTEDVAGSIA